VIVGTKRVPRLTEPPAFLANVSERALLKDVRIHDLEHVRVRRRRVRPGIADDRELLGHTQVQTTVRYAHLAADPSRTRRPGRDEHRGVAQSGRLIALFVAALASLSILQ